MGRRPIPTHLKVLRGNPGKQKLNFNEIEPELPPAPPDPPEYLNGYGRDEWIRLATELFRLKLLTVFDIHALGAYCIAYHRWRKTNENLDAMAVVDALTAGMVVRNRHGDSVQNPLSLAARQAAMDMLRFAIEFGFTPAARSRINPIEAQRAKGKFDGLLAG